MVAQGDQARDLVEVVLEELALFHLLGGGGGRRGEHHVLRGQARRGQALQVTGDQFEQGVCVGGPAVVGDRHPAVEVEALLVGGEQEHVVRLPADAPRQIRDLDVVGSCLGGLQAPDQGGAGDQTLGQVGECELAHVGDGHHGHLAVGALKDDVAPAAQESTLVGGAILGDNPDLLLDVLLQQSRGADEVVLVVLLQDPGAVGIGEGSEEHARRIDLGRDIAEGDLVDARHQIELSPLAHQGGSLVVHRQ